MVDHLKFALILVSGGIDSTAMVKYYLNQGYNITGLFVDHGQLSSKYELEAAQKIGRHYDFPLEVVRINSFQDFSAGEIRGRNLFLLSTAMLSYPREFGVIAIGVHNGTGYIDCSKSFIESTQNVFNIYNDGLIQIGAPFIEMTKQDIIAFCLKHEIPLNLTYSCERGVSDGCGECLSCKDKIKIDEISAELQNKA